MSYSNELRENESTDVHLADVGLVVEVYGEGQVTIKNVMGTVLYAFVMGAASVDESGTVTELDVVETA